MKPHNVEKPGLRSPDVSGLGAHSMTGIISNKSTFRSAGKFLSSHIFELNL